MLPAGELAEVLAAQLFVGVGRRREAQSWVTWLRVALNYATPFMVASLGYLAGCRIQTETDFDDEG